MFEAIRNHTLTKLFWALLGLYLLNSSVDTPDAYPDYIPEDLSYNDQESILEFVVEKMLGYEEAFEEHDEPDSEEHNKKNNGKINFFVDAHDESNSPNFNLLSKRKSFDYASAFLANGFLNIDTPPPKV
ncbi:hypothetical protein [Flagellimonas sp. GZD32]|uniref:hypothetical protein n=1 Tax=Flagellimonas cixiensis TaxID=3228750 RepID=UPI0035C8D3A1